MQLHLQQWVGGNLAKRNCECADLLSFLCGDSSLRPMPVGDDSTTEQEPSVERTGVHVPQSDDGVRLRDRSVVVGSAPRPAFVAETLPPPGDPPRIPQARDRKSVV